MENWGTSIILVPTEKLSFIFGIRSSAVALHYNFDTIAVRVRFGASRCIRVQFVLVFAQIITVLHFLLESS